jgi:arylsulfatase A-like enzyme
MTRAAIVSKRTRSLVLVLLALIVLHASGEVIKTPPNIVFIFADDWGWGDLSVHGSEIHQTPNIDQLATQGTDFHQFTVNSPVCSPSRVAVMTGHFPERYNISRHFSSIEHHVRTGMPDWLDPTAPMLPRVLKDAGYATGHFGKWHLTNVWIGDAPLPDQYGFDEYGAFNLPGENMPPAQTAERAVDFIRRHDDEPFFVNLWLHETHTPHYPESELLQQFENLGEAEQVYAAIVAAGDRDVGKILSVLDELLLSDNTIVIFSSDNGPESPTQSKDLDDLSTGPGLGRFYSVGTAAGMKGQKRSLFAGGIRVPFIVRWPGNVPERKTDTSSVMTAVDLLPTLASVAGALLPANYEPDGESVLSALQGDSFERTKSVYWVWPLGLNSQDPASYYWPHQAYQSGDWKLLVNDELGTVELYNVLGDWYETDDVAAENPEVVQRLLAEMTEMRATFPEYPGSEVFSSLRNSEETDTEQ